jgi:hypothetical protein
VSACAAAGRRHPLGKGRASLARQVLDRSRRLVEPVHQRPGEADGIDFRAAVAVLRGAGALGRILADFDFQGARAHQVARVHLDDLLQRHLELDVGRRHGRGSRGRLALGVAGALALLTRLDDEQPLVRRDDPLLAEIAGLVDVGGDDHLRRLVRREDPLDPLLDGRRREEIRRPASGSACARSSPASSPPRRTRGGSRQGRSGPSPAVQNRSGWRPRGPPPRSTRYLFLRTQGRVGLKIPLWTL